LLATTSGGSFLHVSSEKERSILSSELDDIQEVAEANSLPDIPSTSAILSPEQEKEEILFPDFMLHIEPDLLPILETS
jgi:hypothetical protein